MCYPYRLIPQKHVKKDLHPLVYGLYQTNNLRQAQGRI